MKSTLIVLLFAFLLINNAKQTVQISGLPVVGTIVGTVKDLIGGTPTVPINQNINNTGNCKSGYSQKCACHSECCSQLCLNSRCYYVCSFNGLPCQNGADCCSGICENKLCNCFANQISCTTNASCCSGNCNNQICQQVDGC